MPARGGKMKERGKDERGNVYGDLEVLASAGVRNGLHYWYCECTRCGHVATVSGNHLRFGQKGHRSCPSRFILLARENGIKEVTYRARVGRLGLTKHDAATRPPDSRFA